MRDCRIPRIDMNVCWANNHRWIQAQLLGCVMNWSASSSSLLTFAPCEQHTHWFPLQCRTGWFDLNTTLILLRRTYLCLEFTSSPLFFPASWKKMDTTNVFQETTANDSIGSSNESNGVYARTNYYRCARGSNIIIYILWSVKINYASSASLRGLRDPPALYFL